MTAWVLAVASWALALVDSRPASAAEEHIDIEYSAAGQCPTAQEFITQVLERTDSAELAAAGERVRTFVVEISRKGSEVRGSLVIREPDGTSSQARSLSGSHCSEVAMALALATALAIDPYASFAPRRDERRASVEGDQDEAPPLVPPVPSDDAASFEPTEPWESYPHEAAVDAMIGPAVQVGFGARPALGGVLLLEGRSGQSPFASTGVELLFATVPTVRVAGAAAGFDLAFARPHACLFPVPARTRVRLLSCLGAEVGALRARGSDLPQPLEKTRLWAAASLGPRLLWDFQRQWSADVEATVAVPFVRYRFHFDNPETDIHEVDSVVFSASVRVGARF